MDPSKSAMFERFDAPIAALGWALLLFLGQGTLSAFVLAALFRIARSRSAELRYRIACTGLFLTAICLPATAILLLSMPRVVPPSAAVVISRPDAPSSQIVEKPTRIPSDTAVSDEIGRSVSVGKLHKSKSKADLVPRTIEVRTWRARAEEWLSTIVVCWLVGVGLLAIRFVKGLIDVQRLTRLGVSAATDDLQAKVARIARRAGLRHAPRTLLSSKVDAPAVVGAARPTLLIPADGLESLDPRRVDALLAHEIAHIKRNDYFVNLCQVLIETPLYFHPAVGWASRRIRIERENCCDDSAANLCDGDRLLVARALFAMEERRGAPKLRIAATGGSLRARVARLTAPAPSKFRPAEALWAGSGLIVVAVGLVIAGWFAGPSIAGDEPASPALAETQTASGRVMDEQGRPIAGARVRLYRRDGHWELRHPVIAETTADVDGAFRLSANFARPTKNQTRALERFALVADTPGKAVGWRIIGNDATEFKGDVTLTAPMERTIQVVGVGGLPVPGAEVLVHSIGDRSSASPRFRELLEPILAEDGDGPLKAIAGVDGRASFKQLPHTNVSFLARMPGYAENYAFREQDTIHLSPSAAISGTLEGPDGRPLAGVKVVMHADFMWEFREAVTDAKGRFAVDGLKPRGWDMDAWGRKQSGNGLYNLWIESGTFAVPTKIVTLEPGDHKTFALKARKAGAIHVTVLEDGTKKPVAGVSIHGFDIQSLTDGRRFNAVTDEKGRATFHCAPSKINLRVAEPPRGVFLKSSFYQFRGASKEIDFVGGELETTLTIPPVAGRLIEVSGKCMRPNGTPATADIIVHVAAIRSIAIHSKTLMTDINGRFVLEGAPPGSPIQLYAESADRKFVGTASTNLPSKADPAFQIVVKLAPAVEVETVLKDRNGKLAVSRKFFVSPRLGTENLPILRRSVKSDAQGRIRLDGIVPGLTYHVEEDLPPRQGPIFMEPGNPPWFDEVIVLAPEMVR